MRNKYIKFTGNPIKVINYKIPDLDKLKPYNDLVHFGFDTGKNPKDTKKIIAIKFNWAYEVRKDNKQIGYFIAEDTIFTDDFSVVTFEDFRKIISNTYFRFLEEYKKLNGNKYTFVFDPTQKELEDYYRVINPQFPSQN